MRSKGQKMSTRPGPFGCLAEAAEPEGHGALVLVQDVDPLEEEEQADEDRDEQPGQRQELPHPFLRSTWSVLPSRDAIANRLARREVRPARPRPSTPRATWTRPAPPGPRSRRRPAPVSPTIAAGPCGPASAAAGASSRSGGRRSRASARGPGTMIAEVHAVAAAPRPCPRRAAASPRSSAIAPPSASRPWLTTLISATKSRIAKRIRREAGQVHRQHREGVEREQQRDPADDARQDRAGRRELEVEADEAEQEEDVGDVGVRDDAEDLLHLAHVARSSRR